MLLNSPADFRDFMQSVGGARRDRRESAWSLAPSISDESGGGGSHSRRLSPSDSLTDLDLSFGAFRKIMYEPPAQRLKRRAEEEREIKELYDTASFDELLERHRREKTTPINEVIAFLKEVDAANDRSEARSGGADKEQRAAEPDTQRKGATIKEIDFPSLFVF